MRIAGLLLPASMAFAELVCAQEPAEPVEAGVLFYLRPGDPALMPMESQTAQMRPSRTMITAEFEGTRSTLRLDDATPQFLIKRTSPPQAGGLLIKLDAVRDKRATLLSPTPGGGAPVPLPAKSIPMEYKKFGISSYLIRPTRPLAQGEYGISFGEANIAFLFGVEPGARITTLPSAASPDPPTPRAEPTPPDQTEERLRKLQGLLDQKLISEQDYRARKEDILSPPKPPSIEDRLRKLDGLLKRGLVNREDYDKRRAELLAEL